MNEFEASKRAARYSGDVATCCDCREELAWVKLEDGTFNYVNPAGETQCRDEDGMYWPHETF